MSTNYESFYLFIYLFIYFFKTGLDCRSPIEVRFSTREVFLLYGKQISMCGEKCTLDQRQRSNQEKNHGHLPDDQVKHVGHPLEI